MGGRAHNLFLAVIRMVFLVVVVGFLISGKPPAKAQTSATDAVQNQQIDQLRANLEKHETMDDARVDRIRADVATYAVTVSGMQGETRGIFAALALMQGASLFLQWRGNKRC